MCASAGVPTPALPSSVGQCTACAESRIDRRCVAMPFLRWNATTSSWTCWCPTTTRSFWRVHPGWARHPSSSSWCCPSTPPPPSPCRTASPPPGCRPPSSDTSWRSRAGPWASCQGQGPGEPGTRPSRATSSSLTTSAWHPQWEVGGLVSVDVDVLCGWGCWGGDVWVHTEGQVSRKIIPYCRLPVV